MIEDFVHLDKSFVELKNIFSRELKKASLQDYGVTDSERMLSVNLWHRDDLILIIPYEEIRKCFANVMYAAVAHMRDHAGKKPYTIGEHTEDV